MDITNGYFDDGDFLAWSPFNWQNGDPPVVDAAYRLSPHHFGCRLHAVQIPGEAFNNDFSAITSDPFTVTSKSYVSVWYKTPTWTQPSYGDISIYIGSGASAKQIFDPSTNWKMVKLPSPEPSGSFTWVYIEAICWAHWPAVTAEIEMYIGGVFLTPSAYTSVGKTIRSSRGISIPGAIEAGMGRRRT